MNENLRTRVMDALCEYYRTLEDGSKKKEEIYDLILDVKWAGTPLNPANPNNY